MLGLRQFATIFRIAVLDWRRMRTAIRELDAYAHWEQVGKGAQENTAWNKFAAADKVSRPAVYSLQLVNVLFKCSFACGTVYCQTCTTLFGHLTSTSSDFSTPFF